MKRKKNELAKRFVPHLLLTDLKSSELNRYLTYLRIYVSIITKGIYNVYFPRLVLCYN